MHHSFEGLLPKFSGLRGERLSKDGDTLLRQKWPESIDWLSELLRSLPLEGLWFSLSEKADLTGEGVEMKWMSPKQIVREAGDLYPGIPASTAGYIPVGTCLLGSGNPYFTRGARDSPLYRIYHENALTDDGKLDESAVVKVFPSLSDFMRVARIKSHEPRHRSSGKQGRRPS